MANISINGADFTADNFVKSTYWFSTGPLVQIVNAQDYSFLLSPKLGYSIASPTIVNFIYDSGPPRFSTTLQSIGGVAINYELKGEVLATQNSLNDSSLVHDISFSIFGAPISDTIYSGSYSNWSVSSTEFTIGEFYSALQSFNQKDDEILIAKIMAGDDQIYMSSPFNPNPNMIQGYQQSVPNVLSVDGGAGTDTVIYSENSSYYITTKSDNNIIISYALSNQSGVYSNYLSNVEQIKFNDVTLVFDKTTQFDMDTYLLYDTIFDRMPDNAGFRWWTNYGAENSLGAKDIALYFMQSSEFMVKYGNAIKDVDFISSLYLNTLNRAGDAEGIDYWLGQLQKGVSRADVVVGFAISTEHTDLVGNHINNGFWTS